jgi:hypothetical protein
MFDREALGDLQRVVGEWVAERCAPASVEEAEQIAQQVAQACGAAVVEQLLPAMGGPASYEKSSRPCACGRKAKFMGYRNRGVGTLYGVVTVARAYYHCKQCHRGIAPWDARHGLDERLWTPHVKALVVQLAARLPYQESVDLLEELVGLRIEDSSAEEITIEVGHRMREAEAALMQGVEEGEIIPLVARAPERLYVGMDGASAHIDGSWHEVKTGVIYEGRPGDDGIDGVHNAVYVAAQEPAERFGSRLYLAAAQAGAQAAKQVVVIGDGAEWIWNLADHHYLGATQIVDVWHACEHVHALAAAYYGTDSPQGKRWAQDHCRDLKTQGPGKLLGALKRMKPKTDAQQEAVRRETGYFTRNKDRMQYAKYRRQAMMIGSGPVEAGCKIVVGQRLKGAGMRWCARGADAVLAARTTLLSNHPQLIHAAAKAA